MIGPVADRIHAIQGMRAVAALAVILFHWSFLFVGWAGVWVFFVISGFVITRSLIALDQREGSARAKLGTFYKRRALRILPLYFAVVAAGALILLAEAPDGSRLWELRHMFLALATATVNFYRMTDGYEVNLLFDHYWSLSIEEHFYVVMPLVFLCFRRAWLIRFLVLALVLAPVIRLALTVWIARFDGPGSVGNMVYQFSFGHFDGFSLGALLALWERPIRQGRFHGTHLLAATCTACAVWLVVTAETLMPQSVWQNLRYSFAVNPEGDLRPVLSYAFLIFASAALIVCILERRAWLTVPLGSRYAVYTGNLSYGLYLIHVPLQYLFNKVLGTTYLLPLPERVAAFAVYLVVLYAIAHLSHVYFERPMQGLGSRKRPGGTAGSDLEPRRDA